MKYGENDLSLSGFTSDISTGGLFLSTTRLIPLDRRVHLQVFVGDGRFILFEGVVMRHKDVPAQLRTVERGGFGVRFLHVDELVGPLLPNAASRFVLRYATREDFARAYEEQLKMGGVFLPTAGAFQRDDRVLVEMYLDFARENFELDATVVQIIEGAVRGIAVVFETEQGQSVRDMLARFAEGK